MRTVLDTNVAVSALVCGGVPYKLLQAATEGNIELFTAPALLSELTVVLARPHLTSRLQAQRSSVEQALAPDAELTVVVSPLVAPRAVPRDVDDDRVIAAAAADQADLIVSGEADLLALERFQNIAIVNPTPAVQLNKAAWAMEEQRRWNAM